MNIIKGQIEHLVALLQRRYPDWNGFDHPGFVQEEIDYKQAAVEKAAHLLNEEELQRLLDRGNTDEFISRLETIGHATNLLWLRAPSTGDLGVLYHDALDKPVFCRQVFDLLYGNGSTPERLERYLQYVLDHGLPDKWTFPTYFLFLCHPQTEIFVKPTGTQRFMRRFDPAFKLGRPSAEAYAAFRQLAHDLQGALTDYGPRDMIDIQSLIWVCDRVSKNDKADPLPAGKRAEFVALFEEFVNEFASQSGGREHVAIYEKGRTSGRANFQAAIEADERGDDVTGLVLRTLLPHTGSAAHREEGAWISVAPAINKDVKSWFEGAGWTKPDDWPDIAKAILTFYRRCDEHPDQLDEACATFAALSYSKGFQAGMLTPMLNALRPDDFLLINKKPQQVLNYFTGANYGTRIEDYPAVNRAGLRFIDTVANDMHRFDLPDVGDGRLFDMFSHWLAAIKKHPFDGEELAVPFSHIFQDREEAEWAFDFLKDAADRLGIQSPDDQRVALTLRHGGRLLRLNFGQWFVLDFSGAKMQHHGIDLALFEDSVQNLRPRGGPFTVDEDEPNVRIYQLSYESAKDMDDELHDAYEQTFDHIAQRFSHWQGSPFRNAHRQEIFEAVFDPVKRDQLLREGLPEVGYWKIAPGENAWQWEVCRDEGFIAIGWEALGDVSNISRDEFNERRDAAVARFEDWTKDGASQVWTFAREIKEGDRIVANRGTTEVLGIGTVAGPYYFVPDTRHGHRVPVVWDDVTPRKINKGGWRRTIIKLDEDKFDQILQASPVGVIADVHPQSPFSSRTFELLEGLNANPTRAYYLANKGEFKAHVEGPFQKLFRQVAAQLPSDITDVMETESKIFGRILKNDFGRGEAWDFYWGAFYTKGGKRIRDAQLFVWMNRERLGAGFFIGKYGSDQRKRFLEQLEANQAALIALLGRNLDDDALRFGPRPDDSPEIEPVSWEEWLRNPGTDEDIRVAISIRREDVLGTSTDDLIARIKTTFERLFPFVLLVSSLDPLAAITEYLDLDEDETELQEEYPLARCAAETGFPQEKLERWISALERKKQAVLYGPPGTGKTYLAQRMARHLVGGGDGFIETVQFHPAYSYEDFIQGIRPMPRPDGGLNYPLVPGRFLEFCRKARSRDDRCVLIIDEINRANLSRVFGELMYLLEYRDHSIPLAAGKTFHIPGNVRLIGTMNTADRSIALVDHALRRRFAFIALYTEYDILRTFHKATGFPVEPLITTLKQLNIQIANPHYEVGVTFFLVSDLEAHLEDIWRLEIEPYLEEYFFDQPDKVDTYRWKEVDKKIMG